MASAASNFMTDTMNLQGLMGLMGPDPLSAVLHWPDSNGWVSRRPDRRRRQSDREFYPGASEHA